jgi:hypothetical protein
MAMQHKTLRFAYEWQFVSGEISGSSVRVPAGAR